MASLFECDGQTALVLGAGAGFTTRLNFATIRDVALHEAACVLVINLTHMVVTELTNFAAPAALTAPATFAARSAFISSLHEFLLIPYSFRDLGKIVRVKEWVKIVGC